MAAPEHPAVVDRWHEVQRLHAYLEVMEERVAASAPDEQKAAKDWLTWERQRRKQLGPLAQPLRLPPDPEFKPELLAPFMRGLSPYGPPAY